MENEEPDRPRGAPAQTQFGTLGRPAASIIVLVPILFVVITFLFWYLTWFGKRLPDSEMGKYLTDTSVPHKTQHALSQLAGRISRGDVTARSWYPLVVKLGENPEAGLRLMSAWVMGQDNTSQEFHQELRKLLEDREPMVRWNAALALVRFGDPTGEPQLRIMLRPYAILAPRAGTVSFKLKEEDAARVGSLIARIEPGGTTPALEVRSPLAGRVERRVASEGAKVDSGDEIVLLAPGEEQIWESLRALFLVGQPADLQDVERFARGVPGMSDNVRQQATLTSQAIRARTAATAP